MTRQRQECEDEEEMVSFTRLNVNKIWRDPAFALPYGALQPWCG